MKKLCWVAIIIWFVFLVGPAMAYEHSQTTVVTRVEPTYMPRAVYFQVSNPANGWCIWYPHGDTDEKKMVNIKTVYASLLAALMSGSQVRIYYSASGSNWVVE